ncbi:hypothetical protein [Micromonospora sp. NPDC005324]|uniref:hypothetical protein n=1 Tax=Micromonospora sp. NPDC005324 TaxID=3157033 RepID=UPI00339FC94A
MNFGVRLPGPFRVGISGTGRVSAGVTLGPLSASTGGGARRAPAPNEIFAPLELPAALAELADEGWRVNGQGDGWALVGRRLAALQLETVEGGTVARRVTSRRKVLLWVAVAVVVVAWVAIATG